jgi:hypothetical protein
MAKVFKWGGKVVSKTTYFRKMSLMNEQNNRRSDAVARMMDDRIKPRGVYPSTADETPITDDPPAPPVDNPVPSRAASLMVDDALVRDFMAIARSGGLMNAGEDKAIIMAPRATKAIFRCLERNGY